MGDPDVGEPPRAGELPSLITVSCSGCRGTGVTDMAAYQRGEEDVYVICTSCWGLGEVEAQRYEARLW